MSEIVEKCDSEEVTSEAKEVEKWYILTTRHTVSTPKNRQTDSMIICCQAQICLYKWCPYEIQKAHYYVTF